MSIILNEVKWIEDVVREHNLESNPVNTMSVYAGCLYHKRGCDKAEIRNRLDELFLRCMPDEPLVLWSDILDKIAKEADKKIPAELDEVIVTDGELSVIRSVPGVQTQRLAFALLCIAKFNLATRRNTSGWVKTPHKNIMKMANINTSTERQCSMLRDMRNAGLLRFSYRVDDTSVRVLYMNTDSPVAIRVTDFRNLGFQYMMHNGEKYIQCSNCGLTVKRNSPAQIYCKGCASEIHIQDAVDRVMTRRNYARG
jgi:hypothetical protein